jgi:hypothetical protein
MINDVKVDHRTTLLSWLQTSYGKLEIEHNRRHTQKMVSVVDLVKEALDL